MRESESYGDGTREPAMEPSQVFLGLKCGAKGCLPMARPTPKRRRCRWPDDDEHEEQVARPFPAERVEANCVGERKRDKQQAAGS